MIYGGFWIRFAAYLIDFIVLTAAQWVVYLMFGISLGAAYSVDPDSAGIFETTGGVIAYLLSLVGSLLYFALMDSSAKQGTVGKIALGLVVTDVRGNRIGFGRAAGRYFAKILSSLILLIGFIMIAFTDRKQGLHDIICSTLVLKGKPGLTSVDPSVFE